MRKSVMERKENGGIRTEREEDKIDERIVGEV